MAFLGVRGHNALLVRTPASRVIRLWFEGDCQLVNDSERSVFPKRLLAAQFRAKLPFVFSLSGEKLLGRSWVLIRIAAVLRRLVATTL